MRRLPLVARSSVGRLRACLALALVAALAVGCGDNLSPPTVVDSAVIDAPDIDARVDAPIDAAIDAPPIDARIDAAIDAAIDARPIDAMVDAMVDAPVDAMVDAPVDAMVDAATTGQIQAARDTADGTGLMLPIDGAYVTYLKPALGNDPAGFTIQAAATGPGLFVAVDPATLTPPPAVGDEVRFTITTMGTASALRQATAISNYSRLGTGFPVATFNQNLTNAADVVSALGNYESELVSVTGTLTGSFVAAGSMFEKIQIATTGVPADALQKLRVPATVRDALDLVGTCTVGVTRTPMGRLNTEVQFAAFSAGELTVSNCPAPTVASAIATSSSQVVITFSRRVNPASVMADGSQFTFDNGLTASAATVSGRTVTVTTSMQSVMATYTVTVANTVRDLQNTALGTPSTAMFPGYVVPAVLKINELNANIANGCDLIELRVVTGGTMLGMKLTERIGGSGELNLTFPSIIVPTNGYVVVHLNSGSASCNANGATVETTGPAQQAAAMFAGNYDTAFDIWDVDTGLTATDNTFTLVGPTGTIMDVVLAAQAATGTAAANSETAAATAAAANQWQMVGGGIPVGGFVDDNFRMHAALDLDGTGTAASGTSIQRLDNTDDNDKADWNNGTTTVQAQTFGALNPGQAAF